MAKKKDFSAATENAMDKFFSEAAVQAPQRTRTGRKTDTHKPFSFWALKSEADDWRIWAKARGMKVDDLGTEAMREYISRHELTPDQKQIYEIMKK